MAYSVLCPFQGWSPGERCLCDTSGSMVQTVMQGWCQTWARRYILVGGFEPTGPVIVIPGGLETLATALVFTPGSLSSHLIPRRTSYRRLHTFLRRLGSGNIRIRVPPALRVAEHVLDAELILRDGDSFEIYNDASHSSYRPGIQAPSISFCSLPHFTAWHMPFRLSQGGRVQIWSPHYRDGRESRGNLAESRRDMCGLWSPQWCQFLPPGALPGHGFQRQGLKIPAAILFVSLKLAKLWSYSAPPQLEVRRAASAAPPGLVPKLVHAGGVPGQTSLLKLRYLNSETATS